MEERSVERFFVPSSFSNVGMNPNRCFSSMEVNKPEGKPSVKRLGNLTSTWNEFAAYLNKKQIQTRCKESNMSGSESHSAILKQFSGFLAETGFVPHEEASGTLSSLSTALTVCAENDYWIIDSGATDHMTNKLQSLHDFKQLSIPSKVSLANGHGASVLGKGKIALLSNLIESVALMTIAGWVFMISVGLNAAASVRVSNELGAGNPKSTAFSVVVVTTISFIISVIAAIAVLIFRDVISYAFTEGEVVAAAVSDLTPLLALTLLLNGIQPVLSGVAVGCGWQAFVAYVNVGCYYLVGVPLGVLLGFYFNFGAKGIWLGMMAGTLMQTIILLWITIRTDWKKEVEEAARRLNNWDVKEPLKV
ncbi:PREDICTED: uncharacterized protein LOC101298839 [Fragaria vesca subsp. vesca]